MWQKIKAIRRDYINDILFYVLLFFGLFDAARNYTPLPEWIGYSKDIAIFLLYVLNRKKIRFLPQKMIVIQCVFWFLWGFAGIFYSGGYSPVKIVIGIIKYLELFMLITIFHNWDSLFCLSIGRALNLYLYGSMVIFVVNIIGYYIPNPICYVGLSNGNVTAGFYGGRLSVGQPPIVVLPMLFSCVYLLLCRSGAVFKVLYLITGIVLSTTNTGIVALAACFIVYGIYFLISKKRIPGKNLIAVLIVVGLLVVFHRQLMLIFADQIEMYRRKIFSILQGGKDASMESRKANWTFALSTLQTNTQWLFGRGMYGFCIGGEYHYIENTYVSMLCTYGLLGLGMFLLYLANLLIQYIRAFFDNHNEIYVFGICLVLIYLLHMYTLDTLIIYTMSFAFSFFYTIISRGVMQDGNEEQKTVCNFGEDRS